MVASTALESDDVIGLVTFR